eukprot:6179659-Pleurochrysis_carterae.AAC.2
MHRGPCATVCTSYSSTARHRGITCSSAISFQAPNTHPKQCCGRCRNAVVDRCVLTSSFSELHSGLHLAHTPIWNQSLDSSRLDLTSVSSTPSNGNEMEGLQERLSWK